MSPLIGAINSSDFICSKAFNITALGTDCADELELANLVYLKILYNASIENNF